MEAVLVVLRPKQYSTVSQDFRPMGYEVLLTKQPVLRAWPVPYITITNNQLPKAKISSQDEPVHAMFTFLFNLTGAADGGLKGKRAVFVPPSRNEPLGDQDSIVKGALYCVPVDTKDLLNAQFMESLPSSPKFHPLDFVLESLNSGVMPFTRYTRNMLHRLEGWLNEKNKVPGAICLLFSGCTEDRVHVKCISSSSMGGSDTSRDLVFMRILSAEEFLVRMEETDVQICRWSQCEDKELHYMQVKELLGLRGHLQDELLRIEAMLASDDPELNCLRDFEESNPRVVQTLRQLLENSKAINIQAIDVGIEPTDNSSDVNSTGVGARIAFQTSSVTQTSDPTSSSQGTQSGSHGRDSVGTQSDGSTGEDITEQDLKVRHDEEESHVSADFANKITKDGHRLTQEDMDRLLSGHAISMQSLRKKQELEKQKYKELLEMKKLDRLLKRREQQGDNSDDGEEQDQSREMEAQTDAASGVAVSIGTDDINGIIEDQMKEIKDRDSTFIKDMMSRRGEMSESEFQDLLRRHLADVENLRKWRNADKDRLDEKLQDKLRRRKGQGKDADEAGGQKEEELNLDDDELSELDEGLRSALTQKGRQLNEDELQALLDRYRKQQEQLLKRKAADRAKTDQRLREKLAERIKQKNTGGGHDDSFYQNLMSMQHNGELSEENFADMLKSYLEQDESSRREERRRQRKEQTNNESTRETASNLVQEHQQHTKQIQDLRQREKDITDEKLKKKLLAKKKKQAMSSPPPEEKEEDDFFD